MPLSFTLALFTSARAEAATITFSLDCPFNGPNICASPISPAAGTITLTDNGDFVDILVSVTDGKIKDLHLNFTGTPQTGYSFFSTNSSVSYNPDNEQADGYNVGFFDINAGGNNDNPFLTTLKLQKTVAMVTTYQNLDVSQFLAKSDDGVFWAAVHNNSGDNWVGATSCSFRETPTANSAACVAVNPTGSGATAPEPASLVLLGSGLLGGAWRMRRRRSTSV